MLRPQANSVRQLLSLNGVWDFTLAEKNHEYKNGFTSDKKVAVPGSFNDLFTEDKYRNHMDDVWYQKTFTPNRSWIGKQILLYFSSATYHAVVYLNGKLLGEHYTGYTPFQFNIEDNIKFGENNTITVKLDQILTHKSVPQGNLKSGGGTGQLQNQYPDTNFDFFPYTGLHRDVNIIILEKNCLENIFVESEILGNDAVINFRGSILGNIEKIKVFIRGEKTKIELKPKNNKFSSKLIIKNVKKWDIGEPNLYNLDIELFNEELEDEYSVRFGVRTVKIEGDKFLLNGKPVYFKGFGKHEDFAIIGKGRNDSVNIRDFELMKWVGANSFRTSHYPYSSEKLDLADENGILVISETPAVSINSAYANDKTLKLHKECLTELIERDYNHPSVVLWSVSNEPTSNKDKSRPYFKEIAELTRELDKTRPITLVTCFPTEEKTMDLFDICLINTYPGWYILPGQLDKAAEYFCDQINKFRKNFKMPIIIAEFGADTVSGFHALPSEMWTEEYQKDMLLMVMDNIKKYDFIIGEHIWNFADFRTAQNFFRTYGNRKGLFTRDRQPKMAAHFVRERWLNNK